MPRLSVVLPVRDGMPFLREAVASILAQTYTDFELVISDDFSTDGTDTFLAELPDPRVRVIRPPRELDLTGSHIYAVNATATELVALMGQDDIAMPARLERQIALLDGDPSLCLIGCWCTMIDGRGATVGALRYATGAAAIRADLIRNTQIVAPSMLFRRACYDEAGGFTPDCGHAFDYDLVMRVARAAGCANVPEELLAYRYNPRGASVTHARTVQRGALRARWRELRRGGHPLADWLWLLKPLLALALPGPILRAIIVPYMSAAHGRSENARR